MILNLIATTIPIVVLQLLILPLLAKKMSSDNYGLLVTVLALLNIVPATLGNVLNNIRLLHDMEYAEKNQYGDFNILVSISELLNVIITAILLLIYCGKQYTIIDILLTIIIAILWLLREYHIVAFRLTIDYKAILVNNLIMAIGYGVGYWIFLNTLYWQVIYISGYVFSLIYIFITSKLWREPLVKTELFKMITAETLMLLIAGIFSRLIIYADKILIYPILGGTTVSIYYAATIFGKVVSLIINPISSVVLTYLAKKKSKNDKIFTYTLLVGLVVCTAGYIVCLLISRPILTILYPDFVDESMKYIGITTGVTVLMALIGLLNPFIMRFFSMKWQIVKSAGTAIVYVSLSMTLLHFYGLYGFCAGSLITYILQLLFIICIYFKFKSNNQKED